MKEPICLKLRVSLIYLALELSLGIIFSVKSVFTVCQALS